MTSVEQVENEKLKLKKSTPTKGPLMLQRFFNSSIPRFDKYRVTNPKPQRGIPIGQVTPTCKKYGRNHKGECQVGLNVCYRCSKLGHHAKECKGKYFHPQGQVTQGGQVQPKGGQHNNRFYALHGRQEVEETPDVVTGTVGSLIIVGATLPVQGPSIGFQTSGSSLVPSIAPPRFVALPVYASTAMSVAE
ncbi:uncharacterized protein LOC129892861 [Solanum dulcamara]|uniref:uncharacterized protein LOC129892861 n=1 Tax=Solanum dulcamara TaxID=45834 RepID=UPI00248504BC|nr:uncharacterized protein LOC129892861 [Solanum dulcamara]